MPRPPFPARLTILYGAQRIPVDSAGFVIGRGKQAFVNGQPISRHPVAEGDVVRICEHEIRFTFAR